jgi:creatinine amidohydrolase/Fe(II)-dependent formamide hydrolase-like protein
MGVDSFNAEAVALRVAEMGGGLVIPTTYFGTERERPPEVLDWLGFDDDEWVIGMDFPANSLPSMYAYEDSFAIVVRENLRMIANMGFKIIVAITGHAAANQIETLERVAAEFNAVGHIKVLVVLPFVANNDGILEVGHASRIETSVMLALHPEIVRLDNLPPLPEPLRNTDWAVVDYPTFLGRPTIERTVSDADDPRQATAEAGQDMLAKAAEQILEKVKGTYSTVKGHNTAD